VVVNGPALVVAAIAGAVAGLSHRLGGAAVECDAARGPVARQSLQSTTTGLATVDVSGDGRHVAFVSLAQLATADDNVVDDIYVLERTTGRVSLESDTDGGLASDGSSVHPRLSHDGRYVVYATVGRRLIGAADADQQILRHDRTTGTTTLVSRTAAGLPANGWSSHPDVSGDGRYVVFESFASNLVPGDTNRSYDVFVHDRETHTTNRVSSGANGVQADDANWTPSVSADGRYVAFRSDATNLALNDGNRSSDVYVRDLGPRDDGPVTFTIKPAALEFGALAVGSTTTQRFWLRNRSSTYLALESVEIQGTDRGSFAVAHGCGALVAPEDVCGIRVTFRPATAGSMAAELKVRALGGVVRMRALTGSAF
jgi:hypothetical protein